MKKLLIFLFFLILMSSCSSTKNSISKSKTTSNTSKTIRNSEKKVDKIVLNALKYKGVKYKFGGTTKRGMDCSGLVYVSFGQENFQLPRVSRDMAKKGRQVSLSKAQKGDLLFFKTSKSNRNINHVGLVISNKKGQIRFIHSTSSRGVIVSSISEKYWKRAFVKATNLL